MNLILRGVAAAAATSFDLPEPILEIGSYQVEEQGELCNLRQYFAGKEYVGVDMRAGPGVDCVANVEALPQADGSVGTILALSTFEHVKYFWRGFDELYRVLRPDGALLVAVPFYFHIHNYPSDYWRFTPEALSVLLEKYPQKILGWNGMPKRPEMVWALAFREKHPALTSSQIDSYRTNLSTLAYQPMSWGRRCRYTLGSLLFGRGVYAPYLQRNELGFKVAA